jgi:hypothetical protein
VARVAPEFKRIDDVIINRPVLLLLLLLLPQPLKRIIAMTCEKSASKTFSYRRDGGDGKRR